MLFTIVPQFTQGDIRPKKINPPPILGKVGQIAHLFPGDNVFKWFSKEVQTGFKRGSVTIYYRQSVLLTNPVRIPPIGLRISASLREAEILD